MLIVEFVAVFQFNTDHVLTLLFIHSSCCSNQQAHFGHAKCYVHYDIMRRIITDYFGKEVYLVMNITDVDDKIIRAARQNHLFKEYLQSITEGKKSVIQVFQDIAQGFESLRLQLLSSRTPSSSTTGTEECNFQLKQLTEQKEAVERLFREIQLQTDSGSDTDDENRELERNGCCSLTQIGRDALCVYLLDQALRAKRAFDWNIFQQHAEEYEREFMNDMRALNVREADSITRVSEYMGQIISYIERIIANGFGYATKEGNVYFNTQEYIRRGFKHRPLSHSSGCCVDEFDEITEDSFGPLFHDKLHPTHFAMWKRGKPGEMSWPSPWGNGRCGWHIECRYV